MRVRTKANGPRLVLAGLLVLANVALASDFQGSHHITAYDEAPILYSQSAAEDPVAKLQAKIDSGEVQLKRDPEFGYLLSILEALKVPISSQMLVFSKTSLHRDLISPKNPRAIFFNDDVYVGWVRWAPLLEISAADPKKGGMFYVLPQNESLPAKISRNNSCLECHVSGRSMGVPGHLIRSFEVDEEGRPDEQTGNVRITHETPLTDRWGGWFVTGKHGEQTHLGNLIGAEAFQRHLREPNFRGNLLDLSPFIDPKKFPATSSDIVALLVFEHQVPMHNFIARLHYESATHLAQYGHVRYLKSIVEAFLKFLFFVEESPLTAPIEGTSRFAEEFQAKGPKDAQGRSLRDLDLKTSLFKYPLSYLIYSDAFKQLPGPMKTNLYERIGAILEGKDPATAFKTIPEEKRLAMREILLETHTEAAEFLKKAQ